jgi:hypothetical protein
MNITKTQILTYTSILLAGIILGWLIFGGSHDHDSHAGHDHEMTPLKTARGVDLLHAPIGAGRWARFLPDLWNGPDSGIIGSARR